MLVSIGNDQCGIDTLDLCDICGTIFVIPCAFLVDGTLLAFWLLDAFFIAGITRR
jgi:hypothetical protein